MMFRGINGRIRPEPPNMFGGSVLVTPTRVLYQTRYASMAYIAQGSAGWNHCMRKLLPKLEVYG